MKTTAFRSRPWWLAFHARRLLVAPRVEALEPVETPDGPAASGDARRRQGDVVLRGVVCGVCAVRTRDALTSVPGVESAEVDLDAGRARVTYASGARPRDEDMQRAMQEALQRVVIAMPARVALERVVRAVRGWPSRVLRRRCWGRTP